VKEQRPLSHII